MQVIEVPSSGSPVQQFAYAEGLEEHQTILGAEAVSLGGRLASWRFGARWEGSVALPLVASADAAQWNDWWRRQVALAITFSESSAPYTVNVRMANRAAPFQGNARGTDRWDGLVQLVSVDGEDPARFRSFMLDNSVDGLLDETYNALL